MITTPVASGSRQPLAGRACTTDDQSSSFTSHQHSSGLRSAGVNTFSSAPAQPVGTKRAQSSETATASSSPKRRRTGSQTKDCEEKSSTDVINRVESIYDTESWLRSTAFDTAYDESGDNYGFNSTGISSPLDLESSFEWLMSVTSPEVAPSQEVDAPPSSTPLHHPRPEKVFVPGCPQWLSANSTPLPENLSLLLKGLSAESSTSLPSPTMTPPPLVSSRTLSTASSNSSGATSPREPACDEVLSESWDALKELLREVDAYTSASEDGCSKQVDPMLMSFALWPWSQPDSFELLA